MRKQRESIMYLDLAWSPTFLSSSSLTNCKMSSRSNHAAGRFGLGSAEL